MNTKKYLALASLALGSVLLHGCNAIAATPTAPVSQQVAIETVIDEVQNVLASVQTKLVDGELPPLKSVKLSLQTTAEKKGEAGLKLWIISAGGSLAQEKTQQIEIVLTPPKPGSAKKMSSLTDNLEEAILSAARGAKGAGKAQVPLKLSGLDVTMGFTVTKAGEGGLSFELAPVSIELKGGVTKSAVQTLAVSFAVDEK